MAHRLAAHTHHLYLLHGHLPHLHIHHPTRRRHRSCRHCLLQAHCRPRLRHRRLLAHYRRLHLCTAWVYTATCLPHMEMTPVQRSGSRLDSTSVQAQAKTAVLSAAALDSESLAFARIQEKGITWAHASAHAFNRNLDNRVQSSPCALSRFNPAQCLAAAPFAHNTASKRTHPSRSAYQSVARG